MALFGDLFDWIKHELFPPEVLPVHPVEPQDIRAEDEQGNEVQGSDEDRQRLSGEWIHLPSSNVAAVRYQMDEQRCDVEYQTARFYSYYRVPPEMFLEFVKAPSPGKFVWATFRRGDDHGYVRYSFSPGTRPDGTKNIEVVK